MAGPVAGRLAPGATAQQTAHDHRQGWGLTLRRSWTQTQSDQIPLLAAGVAFFGFLALFPTMIALVLAYGLFADPATIAAQVNSLGSALPAEVQQLITDQVTARSQETGALSVGLIISLLIAVWSASGGVANLVQAINTAYHETDGRNIVKKRALALALTAGAVVFMIILISLVAVLPVVFAMFDAGPLRWLVQVVRWALIALLIMIALAVLYRVAPDRTRPAPLVLASPGAVVATVVWLAVSAGFSFYVTFVASYAKTYGAVAGIVVILMWLWLAAYAVLFGAEINAERMPASPASAPESPRPTDASLESELAATRQRLAVNVGALAVKADLKTQAKRKTAATARRLAIDARDRARRSPALVASLAASVGLVIALLLRRSRSG